MNKIVLSNKGLVKELDDSVVVTFNGKMERFGIDEFSIYIHNNTELYIVVKDDIKVSFNINLDSDVSLKLFEIKENLKTKIRYKYTLLANSYLLVNKINHNIETKELDLINLNGTCAHVDFVLKNIANGNDNIDVIVNHNIRNTESNIKCDGLCINNGTLNLTVTTIVPNGCSSVKANQENEIINLNELNSTIKPLLLIEEYDVEASHSAKVGNFNENDIFYIKSRGIDEKKAKELLINGFLKRNLENNNIINDFIDNMEVKYE